MLPRRGTRTGRGPAPTVETVLHPVGSLPPRVYWKRRLAGVAVVLLLAVVPILLITGGGDESQAAGQNTQAAARPAQTPQLDLVPAETLLPSTTASTTGPSGSEPTSAPPPAGSTPTGSAAPTGSAPPAEPVACTDDVIAVTAGSPQPQWATSAKPVVTMTVTNAGTVACTRDLGASQQEWGLLSGETRLWGSNDCQVEPGKNVQSLQPGQQVTLQVQWSGMTSEPTCNQPRERLAPGEYQLRARLGGVQSGDYTLVLR